MRGREQSDSGHARRRGESSSLSLRAQAEPCVSLGRGEMGEGRTRVQQQTRDCPTALQARDASNCDEGRHDEQHQGPWELLEAHARRRRRGKRKSRSLRKMVEKQSFVMGSQMEDEDQMGSCCDGVARPLSRLLCGQRPVLSTAPPKVIR